MAIQSFRDLRVWQAAMVLVVEVYELTTCLPKSEVFGLTSQMRRAVISVPSNIAERAYAGAHKRISSSPVDCAGIPCELSTQLEACVRLQYLAQDRVIQAESHIASLAKQLYALRNSIKRSIQP